MHQLCNFNTNPLIYVGIVAGVECTLTAELTYVIFLQYIHELPIQLLTVYTIQLRSRQVHRLYSCTGPHMSPHSNKLTHHPSTIMQMLKCTVCAAVSVISYSWVRTPPRSLAYDREAPVQVADQHSWSVRCSNQ